MGRILLCDDEESLCRSLGRILRSAGHEVVTQNGEQGLARLRQERFDLILTDIRMPDVSGFDILAAARLHAPGTPVIAMTDWNRASPSGAAPRNSTASGRAETTRSISPISVRAGSFMPTV